MELIRSSLYVYSESSNHNGKWLLSNSVLHADGTFEVKIQNEDKITYHISSNCVIQAPIDTVWHRTPPLPFRRSVKEALSLHIKKSSTVWFLASSEEERNQWFKHLTSFSNRQPPPYGDYDNWTYPHLDSETLPRPYNPRKSLTSTHRSGFYSVQEPRRNSSKFPHAPTLEHNSGLYSAHESSSGRLADIVPQHRSGFYSVQGQSKKVAKEMDFVPEASPASKADVENEKLCCGWLCVPCMCNIFSVCCQQFCLNCAAAI